MSSSESFVLPIERERLLALLAYTKESVRLRTAPVADIASHSFHALETQLAGLPGVWLPAPTSDADAGGDADLWLRVERLKEQAPPPITDLRLAPLTELTNDPAQPPALRLQVPAQMLVRLGLLPAAAAEVPEYDPVAPQLLLELPEAPQLAAALDEYIKQHWLTWSLSETQRRRTIGWYSRLYALKQQLEGGLTDTALELVWGMGVAVWQLPGAVVRYPLLTRLVELALNPHDMALEVRPRQLTSRLEADVYAAHEVAGLAQLEQDSRPLLAAEPYLSPTEPTTYQEVLRRAATVLDAQGRYLPDDAPNLARLLPSPTPQLQVTDTWALYARPRTNNTLLQDLEALRAQVEQSAMQLPAAVAALVRDPATYHTDRPLPSFRGLSLVGESQPGATPQELYFPLPFNDEQVRIVQLLEHAPGVVVQGPPGTGKTHTIANVICHYLALGRRVLVTSMKDPALAVLRDKLPPAVQPLAISLLTSEREGMKQFEHAVQRIAEEVQRLDPAATSRRIELLAAQLDACHSQLAHIDRRVGHWGQQNLQPLELDGERVEAQEAAREVVAGLDLAEWLPDALDPTPACRPQFDDADITALRTARAELGADLQYRTAQLPALAALPEAQEVLLVHQQLRSSLALQAAVASGELPPLSAGADDPLQQLTEVLAQIAEVQERQHATAALPWAAARQARLNDAQNDTLYEVLEALGEELRAAWAERQAFLVRPVRVPAEAERDDELLGAVANRAQGRSPFGAAGWFGKSAQKQRLAEIRVLTSAPATAADWAHAEQYLLLLRQLHELAFRWNALAPELALPLLTTAEPVPAIQEALRLYESYEQLRDTRAAEIHLNADLQHLLPTWAPARTAAQQPAVLEQVAELLRQHQVRLQSEAAWAVREQYENALHGTTGPISEALRSFLVSGLGQAGLTEAALRQHWATLTQELRRVHTLRPQLNVVTELTEAIARSGAPRWAAQLREQPASGATDELLPADWRQRWRLRRLSSHLQSLDARAELRQLALVRLQAEATLARTYQDIIEQKTWLQLAQNATPQVRSALQAYRNAIVKVGKGKGKSAGRYRRDAQAAAAVANAAIPCWIMPHYRVSESLPAELGAFDLVIIDEASQSNLLALPALLRASKVLIVGDDKQVGPGFSGLTQEKESELMSRFLSTQPALYRPQLSPSHSIYQLFQVVFSDSQLPLREHFRCVGPIIEYSKREFYDHSLNPLRLPKASERLDPPLVDVLVEDGVRLGDTNPAEARFIVEEIKALVADSAFAGRSIGVISLLSDKQAQLIWAELEREIGLETMLLHQIACGDAHTFQGKERDIMFLSLVVSGKPKALGHKDDERRFNVAASRARDRMYLVRSVQADELSPADHLRRKLLAHFVSPYAQDELRVSNLRALCESGFEREVYDFLTERGYRVQPQVKAGQYRIDLVVEGDNDQRLAVECDGDQYHGPDRWHDDLRRQRVLERAGWRFWRCFASAWVRWRSEAEQDLLRHLAELGIGPVAAAATPSQHTAARKYVAFPPEPTVVVSTADVALSQLPLTFPPLFDN
ncbi:AAA domain-containing protein [Hymenobacter psychrotolerans]|uniref:Part of AAA domain-containing protein n=1 Tax=Hymenobacter psychrotolerans DSM 18569 TaxID=1121959 RepID=A0A1M6PX02_9BACT|nr:AAA domain-containing protein [Hymenobacter psychrotolerans]SHK12406.1 Part of AAA domain-containing protein [Hymenobacter psychrotolerans DSM 18569]